MLPSQRPRQEHAWRSATADQEPCKPLREVRATFFPVLDDVTNDGRGAAVTARSHGEHHVKHCRAIMVRSVKDIFSAVDRNGWPRQTHSCYLREVRRRCR